MSRLFLLVCVVLTSLVVATVAMAKRSGRTQVLSSAPSEMVKIKAGSFRMGFPNSPKEVEYLHFLCAEDYGAVADLVCPGFEIWQSASPGRDVYLDTYAIDRYEVTVAQYRACVRTGACDVGALLFGDQRYNKPAWPVVNVNWHDAVSYCHWRGKRLPTDAEWEKAARGHEGHLFPWGMYFQPRSANHGKVPTRSQQQVQARIAGGLGLSYLGDDSDGQRYASAPGAMLWGDSSYGVANMSGNVREWVSDYYSKQGYQDLPLSNPVRGIPISSDRRRSIRAGSWLLPRVDGVAFAHLGHGEEWRAPDLGFRCARSPEREVR